MIRGNSNAPPSLEGGTPLEESLDAMVDVRRDMLKWISDLKKIYGKRIGSLNKI
jgi:hypothetical protein